MIQPDSIKAIVFDIGGVIQPSGWESAAIAFSVSRDRFVEVLKKDRPQHFDLLEKGQTSMTEFAQYALPQLGFPVTENNINNFIKAMDNFGPPDAELLSIIRKLDLSYKLAILSNSWQLIENSIRSFSGTELDYMPYFEPHVFFSHHTGFIKPYREAFDTVTGSLNIPPEQCLFIDDQRRNIDAAHKLGWQAYHYRGLNGFKWFIKPFLPE